MSAMREQQVAVTNVTSVSWPAIANALLQRPHDDVRDEAVRARVPAAHDAVAPDADEDAAAADDDDQSQRGRAAAHELGDGDRFPLSAGDHSLAPARALAAAPAGPA